jgi:hypothetical protein
MTDFDIVVFQGLLVIKQAELLKILHERLNRCGIPDDARVTKAFEELSQLTEKISDALEVRERNTPSRTIN